LVQRTSLAVCGSPRHGTCLSRLSVSDALPRPWLLAELALAGAAVAVSALRV
jgi:hypothetical protein